MLSYVIIDQAMPIKDSLQYPGLSFVKTLFEKFIYFLFLLYFQSTCYCKSPFPNAKMLGPCYKYSGIEPVISVPWNSFFCHSWSTSSPQIKWEPISYLIRSLRYFKQFCKKYIYVCIFLLEWLFIFFAWKYWHQPMACRWH